MKTFGVTIFDYSTLSFQVTQFEEEIPESLSKLRTLLIKTRPVEIIHPSTMTAALQPVLASSPIRPVVTLIVPK